MDVPPRWMPYVGEVIDGKYRLTSFVGAGSFGAVFQAEETILGRTAGYPVIKLIRSLDEDLQRDLDELIALRSLQHPNIVQGLAVGHFSSVDATMLYVAMERADGSLQDRLSDGLLTSAEAISLAKDVASGLAFLHSKKRVHRDVKPANILRFGESWRIADFGLVREIGDRSALSSGGDEGTRPYMPPEAFDGAISPATDTWALGVMLVEAVTGHLPFDGSTYAELIGAIQTKPPRLSVTLPPPLDRIAAGCLAKNRHERLTAQQVLDLLAASTAPSMGSLPSGRLSTHGAQQPPSLVKRTVDKTRTTWSEPEGDALEQGSRPPAAMAIGSPRVGVMQPSPEDWAHLGDARRKAKDWDGAIIDYTEAIRLDQKCATAFRGRGVARQAKGDLDGAIADHAVAMKLDPSNRRGHRRLCATAFIARGEDRIEKGD